MTKHVIAMIIMASGPVVFLTTDYNWIATIITAVVVAAIIGLVGFIIAATNMVGIMKDPSKMLH